MKTPLACFLQTTTRLCTRPALPYSLLPDEVQNGMGFERSSRALSGSRSVRPFLAFIKQLVSPFK